MKSFVRPIILAAVLLCLSFTSASAANVECVSSNGAWEVTFDHEDKLIRDLEFLRRGHSVAGYESLEGKSYRLLKNRYYEFSLGGTRYLDFVITDGSNEFDATFLLSNSPVGIEKHVTCRMSALH